MKLKHAIPVAMLAGILNGLLGTGGGMLIVPALQKSGLDPRKAHATSIAVMLALTVLSCFLYWRRGALSPQAAAPYLVPGVAGAAIGAWLLPRVGVTLLRRAFGALMVWCAVRLLLL